MSFVPNQIAAKEIEVKLGYDFSAIRQSYSQLRKTIIELYDPRVWFLVDACLSVTVTCLLEDLVNPVALILVDGPSSEKTTVLDLFDGLANSHRLDKFTTASFLTQAAQVKQKDLKSVDLLAKIPYKTVLIPDLAPMFNQPKEQLMESYATLARVLDGSGLVNAGGFHGQRARTGDYVFSLLGASTPLNQTAWNTMGKVGSRLLFLHAPSRLSRIERLERSKSIMSGELHYKQKRKLARESVQQHLTQLFDLLHIENYVLPDNVPDELNCAEKLINHCGYLPRTVVWNSSKNDEKAIEYISLLAEFTTCARQDVRVWSERTDDGKYETNSTGAVTEGVERFTSIVYNLARGHALVSGRMGVNFDDLPVVASVALSSLPDDRRKAVELLIDSTSNGQASSRGQLTIEKLMQSMHCTDKTAKKVMEKLEIIELGTKDCTRGPVASTFKLHEDYDWFLSDDFRKCFRPWDARFHGPEPDRTQIESNTTDSLNSDNF